MSKHGRVLSVICWIVLLAAPSATLAGPFDGTYTGKRVTTKGDEGSCPTEDVTVVIKDGTLTFSDSNAKVYTISFDPHPDGSFRQLSANIGGTVVDIRGHINGTTLDADVISAQCQHHWHLQKP